jgi:selenocysteine lyase/cysteine desulfurase
MKVRALALLLILILTNCTSQKNSEEFMTATSGRYLFNANEVLEIYFNQDVMLAKWRGNDAIELLKVNDSSFYMKALNEKTLNLTGYLEFLVNDLNNDEIEIITPKNTTERGCQLSIQVKNADKSLFDAITKDGVIADWRAPDVIRVAPVPMYNSFEDVWNFVDILKNNL